MFVTANNFLSVTKLPQIVSIIRLAAKWCHAKWRLLIGRPGFGNLAKQANSPTTKSSFYIWKHGHIWESGNVVDLIYPHGQWVVDRGETRGKTKVSPELGTKGGGDQDQGSSKCLVHLSPHMARLGKDACIVKGEKKIYPDVKGQLREWL